MNLLDFYTNPYVKGEIESAPTQIGTPIEDVLSSPGPQERPDSCAIRAQQHVLSMFGIERSETELVQEATLHREFDVPGFRGTALEDLGNLLERSGIEVNRYADATMAHLISELGQDHKIIVGVDIGELNADSTTEYIAEALEDVLIPHADHAVVVVGVDPYTMDVRIVDPLDGSLRTIPADQFMDAWKDSHHLMVSTAQSPDDFTENIQTNTTQLSKGENTMNINNPNPDMDAAMAGGISSVPDITETNRMHTIYDPSGDPRGSFSHPSFKASDAAENVSSPSFGSTDAAQNVSSPSFGSTDAADNHSAPSFGASDAAASEDYTILDVADIDGHIVVALDLDNDDVADVNAIIGDSNEDAAVDTIAYDLDVDGNVDVMAVDVDVDGTPDIFAFDLDADGTPDVSISHMSLDGTTDALAIDLGMDGTVDAIGLDLDGDSVIDVLAVDTDGDGMMDDTIDLTGSDSCMA